MANLIGKKFITRVEDSQEYYRGGTVTHPVGSVFTVYSEAHVEDTLNVCGIIYQDEQMYRVTWGHGFLADGTRVAIDDATLWGEHEILLQATPFVEEVFAEGPSAPPYAPAAVRRFRVESGYHGGKIVTLRYPEDEFRARTDDLVQVVDEAGANYTVFAHRLEEILPPAPAALDGYTTIGALVSGTITGRTTSTITATVGPTGAGYARIGGFVTKVLSQNFEDATSLLRFPDGSEAVFPNSDVVEWL